MVNEGNGAARGALARLYEILAEHGISRDYGAAVDREVDRLLAAPGIDDPALTDLTALPFVTIDNPGSRDLDQAMHIAGAPDGRFVVRYALADASHFVRPGGPLYAEAMQRGVTYYLPGLAVPMLPRALCEGIVSLNPGVNRRALVMRIVLDDDGRVVETGLERARINSRRQLTYEGVQRYFDRADNGALDGQPFTPTLENLRAVGERRIALGDERNVIRYNRIEVFSDIDPTDPDRFVVRSRKRTAVERWNEQLSVLCNAEGARFMADPRRSPHITPIFRVHPRPYDARREEFRTLTEVVARVHGLDPSVWSWKGSEPLAAYLSRLPADEATARIGRAIERQALMINRRSTFSTDPGPHHGVGVDPYARFSAPMREMVGIFTHKEAIEKLLGSAPTGWPAAAAREQEDMVRLANETKALQTRVAKAADRLVLDQFLADDLRKPPTERPRRTGTIMGLTSSKIYVQFDEPPFEVKVRLSDLSRSKQTELTTDPAGAQATTKTENGPRLRLGDPIELRVERLERRRYIFRLA